MSIQEDLSTLEPGGQVTLYEVDGSAFGAGVLRFHSHLQAGAIWWQGRQYDPWPVNATGFEFNSDKPPQPTLSIGNNNRLATILCSMFEDMVGAIVTRRRTLVKYLDAKNFPGGNATADPSEGMRDEVWRIERKLSESFQAVEFQLTSAMDFQGQRLPRRQMIAGQCAWQYRSAECGYTGGAVADKEDRPVSDVRVDMCSKRISGCKLRFGENEELPFGGFPGCAMFNY